MSEKTELHSKIEALYPADDSDSVIAETGQRLLMLAIGDWRNLPVEVLMKYYTICRGSEQSRKRFTTVQYRN
ncbi:MAG TPA: hypothetical protein ENI65_02705 [Gammaproteobacteria bacterium]|nr:hypothetical protein [Gammaproteobacteria bacterium]